jgi:hypothetical protein
MKSERRFGSDPKRLSGPEPTVEARAVKTSIEGHPSVVKPKPIKSISLSLELRELKESLAAIRLILESAEQSPKPRQIFDATNGAAVLISLIEQHAGLLCRAIENEFNPRFLWRSRIEPYDNSNGGNDFVLREWTSEQSVINARIEIERADEKRKEVYR